jgi:hypothetical protein
MTVVSIDAAKREKPAPQLPELGVPGEQFFRGFLHSDEYVPELKGLKGLETFEKMRRSDGMIAATLRALKLPILAAKCDVIPASEDPLDIEIAKRFEWNLFEGMSVSWQEHLRQILTFLDFGHQVSEIVWTISDQASAPEILAYAAQQKVEVLEFEAREKREPVSGIIRRVFGWTGRTTKMRPPIDQRHFFSRTFYVGSGRFAMQPMVQVQKISPRLQRTIYKWNLADDGGLQNVVQWAYRQDGGYNEVEIPVEKLLVFVNEKEGANWTGKSVLRPAYKHWFIKDQLYRIDAIAAERHGVGIPVIGLPDGVTDDKNMQRAEDIGAGIRSHERGYVVKPFGWEFGIEGMGQGRAVEIMPMIQHHDRMIAVSVLAPQLAIGEDAKGSFAMHQGQDSFFMLAERAVAAQIADVHNRHLIPKWVRFNYPGVTRFPKLSFGAIETRGVEQLLNALVPAVNAGIVTADDRLENWLRETAGLPDADPTTAREPKPAAGAQPPVPIGGTAPEGSPAQGGARNA